jgi:glycine betaine/proline transport system ATP-binding protein
MEGGRVIQVGAPEEILQNPKDDYVRVFFRGVDPTSVISAADIARDTHPTIIRAKTGSLRAAHEILSGSEREYAFVLDAQHRFIGVVSSASLKEAIERDAADRLLDQAFLADARAVNGGDSMQNILPEVASRNWPIPVVDDQNVYKGVVSKNRFLKTLHRTEAEIEEVSAKGTNAN